MVTASISVAVDSSLIPSGVKPMTLKLVFTASLLDAQHWRDNVENSKFTCATEKGTYRDFPISMW